MEYSQILTPLKIGKITIKNRFCMSPMALGNCFGLHGEVTEQGMSYFEERAQGGFGLLVTGVMMPDMTVDDYNPDYLASPMHYPLTFMRTATELVNRVHRYGAKIFAELGPGAGRNYPGFKSASPVEIYDYPDLTCTALTTQEVKTKIGQIVGAAEIMKLCGFDGVDIHSLHWGYLWTCFAQSITNQRTDQYGGTLENRLRPLKEIREGIRQECGPDFPVSIRVCLKSFISALNKSDYTGENEAGITLEEGVEICKALESYGYDLIMVDAGIYDSFYRAIPPMYIPKGYTLDLAKAVRKQIKVPLFVTGARIDEPYLLERVFSENIADGVAVGRPSLADPFLPKKYEMGKPEEIRPCIGCNTCIMTLLSMQNLHCAVNPTVVREDNVRLKPSLLPKNMIVVGGGIAGMEAARILKLRGNTVTIYEKSNRLGGNLNAAGTHDFKHDVGRLNKWYQNQLENLRIPVILNTELSAQDIVGKKPDAVILSTGSLPVSIKFEGNDSKKVISCLDAIYHEEQIGDKVVIVGGGQIGCEIAIDLASKGKKPTIVEALEDILSSGAAVPPQNKMALKDILAHREVKIMTSATLVSVDQTGANVKLLKEDKMAHLDADTVIIAIGMRAKPSLANELIGKGMEFYEVGDCIKAGDVHSTIHSAFEIASRL